MALIVVASPSRLLKFHIVCVFAWEGGGGDRRWKGLIDYTTALFLCKLSELYIYIWSKNFSHSAHVKSEAKDGGH